MNICKGRVRGPSGIWKYNQLIGATVFIKSSPSCNFFSLKDASKEYTIKNIYVKISLDGKAITVIEIEGIPGKVFTWRDLEIVRINCAAYKDAVCGEFLSGEALVGSGVSSEGSFGPDEGGLGDGVAVIDDKGNIIQGRYIRFVGADVEDPATDPDNITDISINASGDVL